MAVLFVVDLLYVIDLNHENVTQACHCGIMTYTCRIQIRRQNEVSTDVRQVLREGKGKVFPRTGHEGPEGSRGIAILFL